MWTPAGGWAPWTCLPATTTFLSPFPFPALCSHHLHPAHSSHWWGSCCWVAFSETATAFLMASMAWCLCILVLLALSKNLGYSKSPTLCCTCFALCTTLLPSSKSTYVRLVSMSAPPCFLVSTSLVLPCYPSLWNDTQTTCTYWECWIGQKHRVSTQTVAIFFRVVYGLPASESSRRKLTRWSSVSYFQLLDFDPVSLSAVKK